MTARATRSLRARLALTTALAGAALMLPGVAAAQTLAGQLPNTGDATVVAGAATVTGGTILVPPSVGPLNIAVNQNNTVINWRHFDVPTGTTANFSNGVGSGTVAVLNRVVGILTVKSASDLSGTINGPNVEVWLSNTAGIMIGNGAAISTNGLVLTTLDIAQNAFGTGANVHLTNSSSGNIATSSNTATYTLNSNGGTLALIAPAVQLISPNGTQTAGSGNAAFVTATDVTMSNPGSPLGITLNAGTSLDGGTGVAQQVSGTVTAGQAYFLITSQNMVNALLNVNADVTTAAAAGGVVMLGGPGLAQGTATTGTGATNNGTVAAALNGGATNTISAGGAGSQLYAGLSSGTLTGAATTLSATGALTVDASAANANIALANAAVSGSSVSLQAGTGTINVISVATTGNYTLQGSDFLGGSLPTALPGSATSTVSITDTAGGLSLAANTIAPGNLTVNATDAGLLTLNGNVTATGGALNLTGAGGIVLAADTVLTGGTGIALNSATSGGFALALNTTGATSLAAISGLTTVTTNAGGTTTLNGNVTTTAAQTFNDDVTLGANVALEAGAGNITFGGALGGAFTLATDSSGTTSFGTVGGGAPTNALASLTVNSSANTVGNTVLNGSVTTSGAQTYWNPATTTVANGTTPVQTLTSTTSGGITFNSTLDGTVATAGSRQQLALSSTGGSTVFNAAVGSLTPFASLAVTGPASVGANVTADATTFNGAVTLTAASTIANAPVFNSTVGGAFGLTLTGGGTAAAGFGTGAGVTPLTSLVVNGALGLTGDVATSGTQAYNGVVTVTGNSTLSGTTATFTAGTYTVKPTTNNSGSLTLNYSGAQTLNGGTFTDGTNGFANLTVGPVGATTMLAGTFLAANSATFNSATILNTSVIVGAGAGGAAFNGTVNAAAAGTQGLTVNTAGTTSLAGAVGAMAALGTLTTDATGTTAISADVTANTQTYNDAVTATGTHTLFAATDMQFKAGLSGSTAALTLAGAGNKGFQAAGGIVTLGSLTNNTGVLTIAGGGVTTTASQAYNNTNIVLGAATVLKGTGAGANFTAFGVTGGGNNLTLDFAGTKAVNGGGGTFTGIGNFVTQGTGTTTLNGTITTSGTQTYKDTVLLGTTTTVSAGTNAIQFNGTVDAATAGSQSLTVSTSGTTTFAGLVGSSAALLNLATSTGPVAVNTAAITTTGSQTYGGLVSLGTGVTFKGASVTFTGGINGDPLANGVGNDLTLTTPGLKTLPGTSLTGVHNLTASGGGTITLAGNITTSGFQTYTDATTLSAALVTLTSSGNADITFGNTLNATTAGNQGLATATGGKTYFNGDVGGTAALASINVGQTVFGLVASPTLHVSVKNAQTYNGAVTLASTATTIGSTTNGNVTFAGTVDATTDGGQSLAVNTTGTTTFGGAVGGAAGGPTRLSSLTTDIGGFTAINGGSVRTTGTTGAQTYYDAVTLGANTILSGTSVTFAAGVNGGPGGPTDRDLEVTTSGAKTISGANITGIRNLVADGGGTTTLLGTITTSGNQTYSDAVMLGGPVTTASTGVGSAINFNNTVDGAQALTVSTTGATSFTGLVGNINALNSLTTSSGPVAITIAATTNAIPSITTSGNQSYGGPVILGAKTVLNATAGGVTFASTVNGDPLATGIGNDLTLTTTGAKAINGGFTGVHDLLANGGGATTLSGAITTFGKQTYNDAVTLGAATTLASSGTGAANNADIMFNKTVNATTAGAQGLTVNTAGATTFNGIVGAGVRLGSLTTDAAGTTVINAASINTMTGAQQFNDPVTLAASTTLDGVAGNITLNNTVDALTSGVQGLTVNTTGTTRFSQPVGLTNALNTITTNAGGTTTIYGGLMQTTGAQNYNDAVLLFAGTTFVGSPVNFNGGLNAGSGGPGDYDLTLTEGVAHTVDGSLITGVRNLVVNGGGATTLKNALTTSGNQTYSNAVTLATGASTTVTTASTSAANVGGAITFASTVDAAANGVQGLVVNTADTTSFNGVVGGTAGGTTKLASLTTDAPGATRINTNSVITTGGQTFNDPVTLGTTATLQSSSSGTINFANTLDALNSGVQGLTVVTGGSTIFGGFVGGTQALAYLTTDAFGSTSINGGYVSTSGDQTYYDTVYIGAGTTNLVSTASGMIRFASTLYGQFGLNPDLSIFTGGQTIFDGAVGGVAAGSLKLGSLTTDAGGTTAINGGSVVTARGQTYNDQVILGQSTTLTGTTGAFNGVASGSSTTDSVTGNNYDLTLNFSAQSAIDGTVNGVRNLSTDAPGGTTLSGIIVTSGNQTYGDAVTLGAATILQSNNSAGVGGAITFANTLNGAQDLVVNTNDVTTFGGIVGGTSPLASILSDAAGSTRIATSTITTTGSQRYNDPAVLGATATLASTGAGAIRFGSTLDALNNGVQGLTVNTGGATTFVGAVGGTVAGTTKLAALTTDAGGTTAINAGTVVTTGAQSYGDAIQLATDTRLTSTANGALTLATADGPYLLSLTTGGATQFTGVIGGATALNGLALRTGTFTGVTGNRVGTIAASVASGGLVYDDAAALTVGTVDGLSGIATGTAPTTVSAGGLLTLATNVAAGNTSLTGTGITQATGTSVNAGAGTILLDGNDGAFALAGTLTTTNATATAVRLIDSAAATLGTIATGAGGSVTLGLAGGDNLSGNVTQTAGSTITTGTLLGSVGGTATLTNANNNIATLGALSANGLTLRDSRAGLAVTGPVNAGTGNLALTLDSGTLALQGNLVAATGIVTLTSGGAINQTAGGITADTLTGSATGGTSLTSASNVIANLGAFANNGSGAFALTDSRSLTLTGDATSAGDVTINAVGLDFTGRTINAGGVLTLGGGTGAVTGMTATGGTNTTVTGASIGVTTATATNGALALTASGAVTGTTATGGTTATINGASIGITTITATNGALALTASGAVTGTTATGGTTATVNGGSINLGTVKANNGALALTAGTGGLTVGTGSGTTSATLASQGALTMTNALTATNGAATLTATGAASLAQTTAGTALAVTANGITASGTTKSGTTTTLTSGGAITLNAGTTAGTDASFDANGTATLAAVTAGASSGITVRALDAQIGGALTASKVSFVNRSPTTVTFKLGDSTTAGGFQLSQAEVNQVSASTLVFDGGAGNVEFGALAFNTAAGSSGVNVLATGRIDVLGAVSGSGSGRSFRFGGTAATTSDKATVIEVTAKAAGNGGSLLMGNADLELRGGRIGVGQAGGFLTPIGFDNGATAQSVGTVSTAYVANANSSLYNSTYGGGVYQPANATIVSANSLTVRYTDYALFQNTASPGTNAGVTLGNSSTPVKNALVIEGSGNNNAFALFGTINGINGSGTALLGSQVISFSNVNLANTRVNGCLVGSGAGCISSVVSQPVLNVFDSSRLNVFRSADDLAVPFDPVVGNNNEALFSGASVIDAPLPDPAECADASDPSCKQQNKQAPKAATDDKKGK